MKHQHDRPWADRDTFKRLYIDEDKTQEELMALWGCSKPTVSTWVRRHGLFKGDNPSYSKGEDHPPSVAGDIIKLVRGLREMPEAVRPAIKQAIKEMVDQL